MWWELLDGQTVDGNVYKSQLLELAASRCSSGPKFHTRRIAQTWRYPTTIYSQLFVCGGWRVQVQAGVYGARSLGRGL